MSWMQRPQGGAPPPPGPDQPPYCAPQQFDGQQNMYGNYQGGTAGNAPRQQVWGQTPPQQQPQYNQQYGQVYQHQQAEYANNANQYYQQPVQPAQYSQGYNQTYNTGVQPGYQQNLYPNQGMQQNYPQNKTGNDTWEDNWDWGWEDSSKQGTKGTAPNVSQTPASQPAQQTQHQQIFNNANVIAESFATTDSWNWSMEDKKEAVESLSAPAPVPENKQTAASPVQNTPTGNNTDNDINIHSQRSPSSNSTHPTDEVKTLNDRDIVKERLPNLALGKRFHLDNLTPQWSIESQMSQESSDGPHTYSEGTYRSDNQSRNSSKSSPGLNTENSNFNYSQSGIEDLYPLNSESSKHSVEEPTLADHASNHDSRRESHDELTHSLHEMNISNSENPAPDTSFANQELRHNSLGVAPTLDNVSVPLLPPPSVSPSHFSPHATNQPLALPPSAHAVSTASPLLLPPSSSSSLPPPNFPPTNTSQNPFKHAGAFSHKNLSKPPATNAPTMQPFSSPMSNTNLTSPSVVNKVSQHNRVPVGFGANLETTPDNSERPDQPQLAPFRPMPVAPQVPDNLEVAPRNDRNEYLQTAHLSSGDFGENTDFSRGLPPPGLRRMVLGQQESEYTQNLNLVSDEPPPGLARMVPGQQTESENSYNQSNDNYLDRHVDGGPMDGSGRPYRQADGQQMSDNYSQPPPTRGTERRPIGMDRMVPGEPSNDDYSQYQATPYATSNEHRVVTGVDHEYSMPADPGPIDIREQNMDGSDYTEQTVRNPSRSVIGARESSTDTSPDFSRPDEQREQREIVMEGENLQDLSVISSTELTFSREQTFDGADVTVADVSLERKVDAPESLEHSSDSRRQSLNHVNTSGEDSERDRLVKSSPRRDKHKTTRDRDKEGRYSRGDRKYDRESERRSGRDDRERRSERDRRDRDREHDRKDKDESPDARRNRRSTRDRDESPESRRLRRSTRSHRYETEDTDYYSDRERYQRRHREGSYTSGKPPRHDGERRHRDDRDRRYNTAEREPSARHHRDRDRYEQRYRDIDPSRKYGNLRKERDDERKRVVTFSSDAKSSDSSRKEGEPYSPSRADSREPTATDDERDPRRRDRDRRSRHHRNDAYYDAYGTGAGGYSADPYLLQRQQYQYYERLRVTDPAAYMQIYKMMAGQQPHDYRALYGEELSGLREERGSVHSGRSSAAGLKGNDTYYGVRSEGAAASLVDAPSLRTDISDRDLTTDASLNLHLEDSTVRSERMTPFRYSTAHIKGSISSRHLVVVCATYPVDGRPARVTLASLEAALAHTPAARQLAAYPGPLVKGVTHKKSVIEYCESRARGAPSASCQDALGYVLIWELLALLLRQNGVVVGTDIAELLMKNAREYEYNKHSDKPARSDSRRESSLSGERDDAASDAPDAAAPTQEYPTTESPREVQTAEEPAALERLREYLTYGNRQEALEHAMSSQLWGHALLLSWYGERRTRAAVAARFVSALPRTDPLHTLYSSLAAKQPPVATCVSRPGWGDWRPHAAIILSNTSGKPDQDRKTLIQLGDTLSARGLIYSAQFCYISGGVPWAWHPLAPPAMAPPAPLAPAARPAPPRLSLLLADPRAQTFAHHATDEAIFATEIYEYALSLNQDYIIKELQMYKLVLASRLADCGLYERALHYTEQAARAVTRDPSHYPPALVRGLAALADRLRYHDPLLQEDPPLVEEGDSGEPSPRHQQWLDDVKSVAEQLTNLSAHGSPQHAPALDHAQYYQQQQQQQQQYDNTAQWTEQAQQYHQPLPPAPPYAEPPAPPYAEPTPAAPPPAPPVAEESGEYAQYPQYAESYQPPPPQEQPQPPNNYYAGYEDYAWNNNTDYGYGDQSQSVPSPGAEEPAGAESARPMITMPGASAGAALYADYDDDRPPSADTDRESETPKLSKKDDKPKEDGKPKSGWLGGILTRLSLRPPNQMILPDDKNPTIVWDAEHKRWRNLDGDEDAARAPPPPPKSHELATQLGAAPTPPAPPPAPGAGPAQPPPAAPPSNIFKMQKSRHIKKSYVDVFNPSGAATRERPPAQDVLGPAPLAPLAPPSSYFVPAPAHQVIEFPPSPRAPTPRPSTPVSMPRESGVFDPSQAQDDAYRSGI